MTGLSNLNDGHWVVHVRPGASRCHDGRERLANHAGAWRDVNCVGDLVDAMFEVEDLVLRDSSVDGILNCLCIIRNSVTSRARAACADEVADAQSLVLWL